MPSASRRERRRSREQEEEQQKIYLQKQICLPASLIAIVEGCRNHWLWQTQEPISPLQTRRTALQTSPPPRRKMTHPNQTKPFPPSTPQIGAQCSGHRPSAPRPAAREQHTHSKQGNNLSPSVATGHRHQSCSSLL